MDGTTQATPSAPPRWWLVGAVVLAVHAGLWRFESVDMHVYLLDWLGHIRREGMVGAFATPFSNYNPPYLYLMAFVSPLAGLMDPVTVIKLLSVAGTVWLAVALHRLLTACGVRPDPRFSALVMLLPSVAGNAAMLGQCDAMWSAACLTALTHAVRRESGAMLVWCGIAVAFKAQAVFFAPFALVWVLQQRVPVWQWPVAGLAYAAMLLPAWVAGWPAFDLATIYLRQAEYGAPLSWNAPNMWVLLQSLPGVEGEGAVRAAFGIATLAVIAYVAWLRRVTLDAGGLVLAALLSALMLPGLLPKMHERFFFLADVLAFAFVMVQRDRESRLVLIAVQGASALALFAYVAGVPAFAALGGVLMIGATLAVAALLIRRLGTNAVSPAGESGGGDVTDGVRYAGEGVGGR